VCVSVCLTPRTMAGAGTRSTPTTSPCSWQTSPTHVAKRAPPRAQMRRLARYRPTALAPACPYLHVAHPSTRTQDLMATLKRGQQTPKEKFDFPQTSSQEYGWEQSPEVRLTLPSGGIVCAWGRAGDASVSTALPTNRTSKAPVPFCTSRAPRHPSRNTWPRTGSKRFAVQLA
jgi:hypothetical protein